MANDQAQGGVALDPAKLAAAKAFLAKPAAAAPSPLDPGKLAAAKAFLSQGVGNAPTPTSPSLGQSAAPPANPAAAPAPAAPVEPPPSPTSKADQDNALPSLFAGVKMTGLRNNDKWYDPARREWESLKSAVGRGVTAFSSAIGDIAFNELNPQGPFARPTPQTKEEKQQFVAKYGTTPEKKQAAETYIRHLGVRRCLRCECR